MKQQRTMPCANDFGRSITRCEKKQQPYAEADRAPDNSKPIRKKPADEHAPATARIGTVRVLVEETGYGFISDNVTGKTYFIYRECLRESVKLNDQVYFEIEKTPGGYVAANVRKILLPA